MLLSGTCPVRPRPQVLTQAGPYVKEEVVRALIVVITNAPDLHGYCARAMYRALQRDAATADPALVTAATWVIGQSLGSAMRRCPANVLGCCKVLHVPDGSDKGQDGWHTE